MGYKNCTPFCKKYKPFLGEEALSAHKCLKFSKDIKITGANLDHMMIGGTLDFLGNIVTWAQSGYALSRIKTIQYSSLKKASKSLQWFLRFCREIYDTLLKFEYYSILYFHNPSEI